MRPFSVSLHPPDRPPEGPVFARFTFGSDAGAGERDLRVPLRCLDAEAGVEVWQYPGPSWTERDGDLRLIGCDDYLLVATEFRPIDDMRLAARAVYAEVLSALRERGYEHIIKAWNYFPEINRGGGDSERYKQFCLGRADAFEAQMAEIDSIPAATAIGTRADEPFTLILLAARHPVQAIENPRQVSAYCYPREYGPSSPLFSRAALLTNNRSGCLFISGTAAIVGHQSRHPEDAAAQTEETLANLEALLDATARTSRLERAPRLRDSACLRVYVRDPALASPIRAIIEPLLATPTHLVVLEGAVCRQELRVEVDGVLTFAINPSAGQSPGSATWSGERPSPA